MLLWLLLLFGTQGRLNAQGHPSSPSVPVGFTSPGPDLPAQVAIPSHPSTKLSQARNADPSRLGYVTASTLNVRRNPGTSHAIIAQLSRGESVEITGRQNDAAGREWLRVSFIDKKSRSQGWVAAQYVGNQRPSLIHEDYTDLDYQPVARKNHTSNPRCTVKGVYVSIYSAASSRLDELVNLAATTEINALVIDVKDDRGQMLFKSHSAKKHNPKANDYATIKDIRGFIKRLRAAGIYTIARIVVFKDPLFAESHRDRATVHARNGKLFKSQDGMLWASPRDSNFQQYNLEVAKEAASVGFNEVQFDYVRFPVEYSNVNLHYPGTRKGSKARVIQDFLIRARRQLEDHEVYLSADVFGLVCRATDDMNIGQYWEAISNVVDYICPMMYPSHYANNSYGLRVPDRSPYELMNHAVGDAVRRNGNIPTPAEIRPWIQGFTASWVKEHRKYGPTEIKAQIRGMKENGIESYLVWSPGNRYSTSAYR